MKFVTIRAKNLLGIAMVASYVPVSPLLCMEIADLFANNHKLTTEL